MTSPRGSLLEHLREATRARHRQLEAVPFFDDLEQGRSSPSQYAGLLRVMALLHAAVDRACRNVPQPEARELGASCGARGREAELDLKSLGLAEVPHAGSMQHAVRASEDILLAALDEPASLVGALYVLHGSRHGARRLQAMVAERFPGDTRMGFWTAGTNGLSEDWKRFSHLLEQWDPGATEGACELAAALFEQLEGAMRALHDQASAPMPTAAMVNEQAGNHAVATEPRLMVASLMAGFRCYRAYPYFEARYGLRGRRFGSSDSAWLATLVDEPATVVHGQIDWLGEVLSCRGMPRLLLEEHLRLLHEELTSYAAVDTDGVAALMASAQRLRQARIRHVPDDAMRTLEASFHDRLDEAPALEDVPALIAAAVADEREGIDRAVPSLLSWLGDEERFGAAWAEAVYALVDEARMVARSPQ